MIRVLQIIPTLDQGGAEKQLTLLAANLPRDQFDVHVCLLTRSGPLLSVLNDARIPVIEINKRFKFDPAAYWRLSSAIKKLSPDIVHTWLFAGNSYGRQAARSVGVKKIVAGERCVDRWKQWYEFAVDRYLARSTDKIVANSGAVQQFYMEHGLPGDRWEIIPNGVPEFKCETTIDRDALLAELNLPADARLIGAIGRLWPQKRLRDLIWAMEILRNVRDDAHLLIIGDGPQRSKLTRYSELVEIDHRVHFLGHRSDVPRLLPHMDVVCLASEYEGQPNSVMEAMSAGVPVVGSDIPGTNELVVHGETGMLVPLGDRAAIAREVNELLNDPERAEQFGAAAKQRMATEFSVEKMVERHVDLYRRLVDS